MADGAIKIICVGNPYLYPDNCAYKILAHKSRFKEFIWVEGGLGGMSLIEEFDFDGEIYLIDYIPYLRSGVVIKACELIEDVIYDHQNALLYLLALLKEQRRLDRVYFIACKEIEPVLWRLERL